MSRPTPDGFEQRLLMRAREQRFRRGECIVVGFSGGRDSLALAAALRRARTSLGLELLLVHIDHRLRPSSADEARQAEDLATALGLPCQTRATEAPPDRLHPHVGPEEAARRERYRLLRESARQAGARAVVTAHHREDQAETVLLHLLRGGGVHGAAGMSERSALPAVGNPPPNDISPKAQQTWLWRPLLHESRQDIDRYAARLGLNWIEDPSNDDAMPRRNVVRQQILPLLEENFPGAAAALSRYAGLAAADDAFLQNLAATAMRGQVDPGGRLQTAALTDLPRALQRRMVRRWLADVTGAHAFTAERTDAVIALAQPAADRRVIEIGEHWVVRRDGGVLVVQRSDQVGEESR